VIVTPPDSTADAFTIVSGAFASGAFAVASDALVVASGAFAVVTPVVSVLAGTAATARGFATAIFFACTCGTGTFFGLGSVTLASCGGVSATVTSAGCDGWRAIRIAVATRQTAASPITPAPMAFAKRLDFFECTGGFFERINVTPWLTLELWDLQSKWGAQRAAGREGQ
jgi:hypothetical protein